VGKTTQKKQGREPAESVEARLRRLASANEALQGEIAERLVSESDWAAERTLFRAMIDQVPDYLFVKDSHSRFVIANRAVAADLGRTPEDLIGKTDFELHPIELAARFFADEQGVIRSGEPMLDIEEFVVEVSGSKKWLSTTKVPLRNRQGEIIGIVGISRDVTERKRAEDQIHFMAHHDALTGLPNRTLLMDRLTQALLQSERNGRPVTAIFIDLDNFKVVNDSLGHSAGDALLRVVAERMVDCVRATDTVVRLGGDEFVILLIDQGDGTSIASVLDRVRAAISEPVQIEGQLFHVTGRAASGLQPLPTMERMRKHC
jgi:diguanylate cyclase (GGDEF)-like protein/PAS domain S-box-containing protein